jgi:hypothetical protein
LENLARQGTEMVRRCNPKNVRMEPGRHYPCSEFSCRWQPGCYGGPKRSGSLEVHVRDRGCADSRPDRAEDGPRRPSAGPLSWLRAAAWWDTWGQNGARGTQVCQALTRGCARPGQERLAPMPLSTQTGAPSAGRGPIIDVDRTREETRGPRFGRVITSLVRNFLVVGSRDVTAARSVRVPSKCT